ncbi:MAG: aminopeptidase [Thermoplasmata archaeon]|nr:aminopeptidase [Thermoplasmata archaeon]
MVDPHALLARRVLADNLKVRKGESVLIESWTHSLPYARAFVQEARRLGARPNVLYEDEAAWWDSIKANRLGGFKTLSDAERGALEGTDVYIYFWGPEDRPRLQGMPDSLQEKVTGFNEEWYRVAHKAGVRGCRMTLGQATDSAAKRLGVNGAQWRSRMVRAGSVDTETLVRKGRATAKMLESGQELRIRHPNGTDLRLALSRVHTRVDSGRLDAAALKRQYGMLANNPSGQVLAAIDGGAAEGTVVSNRPVFLGYERYEGIRWTFSDGHLTERSYATGGKVFERDFGKAPKGRDELGLISVGLNPESKELIPLEDTEEGAVLFGIGNNGFVGGKIRIPFQGYALLGGATVEVDGTPIARSGRVL